MKALQTISRRVRYNYTCVESISHQPRSSHYHLNWCYTTSRLVNMTRNPNIYNANSIINHHQFLLAKRTQLSAREPRKRLPIEVQAIKRDVHKMQQSMNVRVSNRRKPVSFFGMVFGITFITYSVCYMALDPDWIAEIQVELHHNGWISALNFAIFGKVAHEE